MKQVEKNQKSKIAYMNSHVGESSSPSIPATKTFTCQHCNKQMKYCSKYSHLRLCVPKTLSKREPADLTDNEKQLIDEMYKKIRKIIQRKQFPYKIPPKKHFPNKNFY